MRLVFLRTAMLAALSSSFAIACAGSAATETTPDKLASAPPPVLPLPVDMWAVAPDGAALFYVDAVAVRSSPHTAFLRELARAHCLKPEHEALLFEKTTSVLMTGYDKGGKLGEGILVFQGTFAESDAQRLIELGNVPASEPVTERMHKRIRVLSRGRWSVARIGDSLLVLGDHELVQRAAALAEGEKLPRLADNPLLSSTGARAQISNNTAVIAIPAGDTLQQQAGKSLRAVGLPRDLLSGVMLGLLKLNDAGAQAELRIHKESPEVAADMATAIQRKLGQLSLLARLAGLPPVLDKTEAHASEAVLKVTLSASPSDLEALRGRLAELVEQPPASCPP